MIGWLNGRSDEARNVICDVLGSEAGDEVELMLNEVSCITGDEVEC